MYTSKLEELRADFDRRENNLKRYVRMLLAASRAAPETMLNIEAILIAEEASVDVPLTTGASFCAIRARIGAGRGAFCSLSLSYKIFPRFSLRFGQQTALKCATEPNSSSP
jgi:hypothetical protein